MFWVLVVLRLLMGASSSVLSGAAGVTEMQVDAPLVEVYVERVLVEEKTTSDAAPC